MLSGLLLSGMFLMMLFWFDRITSENYKGGYPGPKVHDFLLKKISNTASASSDFFIVKSQIAGHPRNSKTKFVLEINFSSKRLRCYEYGNYIDSDNTKPETYLKEKPFLLNYNFNNSDLSYLDNFFKTSDSKTNIEYFKVKDKYIKLEDYEKEKLENDVIQLLKNKNLEKSNNKLDGTESIFQKVKSDMHLDYNFENGSFFSSVNSQKYNFVYFNRFKNIIPNVYLLEVKELVEYPNSISSKKYLKKDFLIFHNSKDPICLTHVLSFSFKNDTLTLKFKDVYFEDKAINLKEINKVEQKQIIDTIEQFIMSSKSESVVKESITPT